MQLYSKALASLLTGLVALAAQWGLDVAWLGPVEIQAAATLIGTFLVYRLSNTPK